MSKQRIDQASRVANGLERRARTRAAILNATFQLLGREHGRVTRIEEICATANISRATFYNHFDGLDSLFAALTYEISHEFNAGMLLAIASMTGFAERTSAAIRYHIRRASDDSKWGWAMVHISAGGPIFGAESSLQASRTVQEGLLAGKLRHHDAAAAVDLTLGGTLAAMIRVLREAQQPDYPERVAAHILRGLAIPESTVSKVVHMKLPDPFLALARLRDR